jgi:hypothetical protein
MIRIALRAVALLSAYALAHADSCSGIITSNGVCIGSSGNVDPPTIDALEMHYA